MPYVKDSQLHGQGVFAEEYLIALGLGMVYNHSSDPNAEWEINEEDNRFIRFVAVKEIKENEEICHDYGDEYWESR